MKLESLAAPLLTVALAVFAPAQAPDAGDETGRDRQPTIEELEALADQKLREASRAVADKIDLNVNSLTRGARDAAEARDRLIAYGAFVMSDGRSVAAHLVDRMLAAKNERLRRELRTVLVGSASALRRSKDVENKLLAAAKEADHRIGAVVDVLIAMRSPTAATALTPLAGHAEPDVRAAVLRLFGQLGDETHASTVIGALQTGDESVRIAAIEAIRIRGYREGIAPLCRLVDATEPSIAEAAIDALAALEAREAAPALLAALLATSGSTRGRRLVKALGDVGTAKSVTDQGRIEKALKSRLSGRDRALAREAAFSLAKLGAAGSDVEKTLTKDLKNEISRDARNIFARLELARVYKSLGDYAKNRSYYLRAIKEYKGILKDDRRRKSQQTATFIALAGCYSRIGQFQKADSFLGKAGGDLSPILRTHPDFEAMRAEERYAHWFR